MNTDISTTIGGIALTNCLYNASGPWCTTEDELRKLGESQAGAILTKSATLEKREGNPKPRYFENKLGSINSMGLPNMGYGYYAELAPSMQSYQKPYLMSVSGLTLDNNVKIIDELQGVDAVAAIELNLSCPNVPGKPQTGYDFEQMKHVLESVCALGDKPLGVKLPPYFDMIHFQQVADILNQFPIKFVTCVNSIGNGLVIDVASETVVIKPKKGFGGVGGDYIKPTALANVRQFYTLLRDDIDVIGCGGVKSGSDAFEHILCGASAVQIGTEYMRNGITCFERIAQELQAIMQEKGYAKLSDFRGKLKAV